MEPEQHGIHEERMAKELAYNIKTEIGSSVDVQIEPVGTLPRSEGKPKRVIDLRDPGKGVVLADCLLMARATAPNRAATRALHMSIAP